MFRRRSVEWNSNSTNSMKKKSASKSAFFNLRVLIGLCIALAGISLALVGLDAFAVEQRTGKDKESHYYRVQRPSGASGI